MLLYPNHQKRKLTHEGMRAFSMPSSHALHSHLLFLQRPFWHLVDAALPLLWHPAISRQASLSLSSSSSSSSSSQQPKTAARSSPRSSQQQQRKRKQKLTPLPMGEDHAAQPTLSITTVAADVEKADGALPSVSSMPIVAANMERAQGTEKPMPKQLTLRNAVAKTSNTISYVQVLGTGLDTGETVPTVLLFFDHRRYIFNAGEGLQRFCTEHKVKLSKIDHVFFTRVCSETAGGLPGLLLTMAGIGDTGLATQIWGPSDFQHLVNAMRTFVPNASVVHTHSFGIECHNSDKGNYSSSKKRDTTPIVVLEDELVKISAIILFPSSFKRERDENIEEMQSRLQKIPRLESPQTNTEQDTSLGAGPLCDDVSVVYICELPEVKGKFDIKKAAACGIKAGPKYGKLQKGQSVISDDGERTIYPDDVLGPSSPGPIVILIDCPSVSYIPSLINSTSFPSFFAGSGKVVSCMVHLSPCNVTDCTEYQNWMMKFGDTNHIMTGQLSQNVSPILKSSAKMLVKLNFICPQVFPILGFQSKQQEETPDQTIKRDTLPCLTIPAENLLKFCLRPLAALGVDGSSCLEAFNATAVLQELVTEIPEIVQACDAIREIWKGCDRSRTPILLHDDKGAAIVPVKQTEMKTIEIPVGKLDAGVHSSVGLTEPKFEDLFDAESFQAVEDVPECLEGIGREEMEIVFLGTCSSQPSKYRNVSAIYVHLFNQGGILLDCGEGTYGQLKRRFGASQVNDLLVGLKCIWISHIHADHHTGLARILSVRRQLMKNLPYYEPVLVVGPKQLKRFLDAYERVEDLGMEFLDCSQTTREAETASESLVDGIEMDQVDESPKHQGNTMMGESFKRKSSNTVFSISSSRKGRLVWSPSKTDDRRVESESGFLKGQMQSLWQLPGFHIQMGVDIHGRQKLKTVLSSLGLESLTSVPVLHCPHAFGVVLEGKGRPSYMGKIKPGWKLVYSGDTRPCQALLDASQGATLLIHEATFDDSMLTEAVAKNHSLTKEAIDTGIAAGAYRIFLTHFSQRYPKIPVFDESYTDRTCIAFDMMTVNLADLPVLPRLMPYLKLLFRDEMIAEETIDMNE